MKSAISFSASLLFLIGMINQSPASIICATNGNINTISVEEVLGGAYLTYADKFGGEISNEELRTTTELGIAGCAVGSKIYAFNLVVKANGKTRRFVRKSYVLSKEILKSLQSLKPGDTFKFTEIRVTLPSGSKIDALGRTFTIV